MSTVEKIETGLEVLFVWWVLNHTHPRKHKHHKADRDLGERVKKAAEEDDEAADAEETFEEPIAEELVTPGAAAAAGEAGEFVVLL